MLDLAVVEVLVQMLQQQLVLVELLPLQFLLVVVTIRVLEYLLHLHHIVIWKLLVCRDLVLV